MGPSHRALVIEDNLEIRQLITRVLERESYTVDGAGTGAEGIRRLSGAAYTFVVVDLIMPGGGGEVVLEHLSTTDPAADRKVVVITAAAPRIVDRLLERSRWLVLPKPFDIAALVAYAREARSQAEV